ncbi:hypothetical protein HRR83_005913 [Exophiala dermatitidis]|uniref:CFEM domain-containing protein n=2 Tax=Exophiala dermatitidis TaxID=5970 RepID=H6BNQ7_EXODN
MKSFTVASVAALALAVPAFAQDITSLPQCAQSPILNAISSSGCGLTDIECICKNDDFVSGLVKLIPTLCNTQEVQETIDFAKNLCSAYGVTINVPDATALASSATAPAASSAASSLASSASAEASSITSAASSVASSASAAATSSSAAASSAASSSSSAAASQTASQTESAAATSAQTSPAQYSGNAGVANTVGMSGLMGALAVGLLAAA